MASQTKPHFAISICLLSLFLHIQRGATEVADSELFPYGGDDDKRFIFGDDAFQIYTFKIAPFFNETYDNVFISGNGQISFRQGVGAYTPSCLSSTVPMIMAYWADSNDHSDPNAMLLYRETTNRTLLRKAARDVFSAFPNLQGIHLSWMFIVTWKEIPFFGANRPTNQCQGLSNRNTFQLTLVSDGSHSFVLMYYNKIEWTTGTMSGGNCNGTAGAPAKVGFDYGDKTRLYTVPSSCDASIINITQTSNILQPGKWVFRIDSNVDAADCESFDGTKEKLKMHPTVVSILGNVPLKMEGPCLKENVSVSCIFHDVNAGQPLQTRKAGVVNPDRKGVTCPLPYFYGVGRTKVELEVYKERGNDEPNQDLQKYLGYIYVVDDDLMGDHLNFTIQLKNDSEAIEFRVEWDPTFFHSDQLGRRQRRSLGGNPIRLDLGLEIFDGRQWSELGVLRGAIENTGSYQGPVNQNLLRNALKFDKSLVTVSLTNRDPLQTPSSSRAPPAQSAASTSFVSRLGKMFANVGASIVQFSHSLSHNTYLVYQNMDCDEWLQQEPPPPLDGILACPPTLELAEADGNFEDDAASLTLWYYHPGGKYSKRQKLPANSGAGSQCVYDENGRLMSGPPGGGTYDRYSPNYSKALHFLHDVLPFLACCKQYIVASRSKEECNRYYDKRPSDNGTNYPRPRPVRAVGDPHITTFDGLQYTFNGVGEFWMVKHHNPNTALSFKLQARMEQYATTEGVPMEASVFTAFAMEEAVGGEVVRLQVSYSEDKILLLLDEDLVPIADIFGGVSRGLPIRYKSAHITVTSESEVIVTLTSGFTFHFTTVGPNEVALNLLGMARPGLLNLTEGLMGTFDGNEDNDLKKPDGIFLPSNSTLEEIHYQFGLAWLVEERDSIFRYAPGLSYADYSKPEFTPTFTAVSDHPVPADIQEICESQRECIFDYITTGSKSIAAGTKERSHVFDKRVEVVSTPVKICKSPHITNGYFQVTTPLVGGEGEFACNRGYHLKGGPLNCTCVTESNGEASWECSRKSSPICAPNIDDISTSSLKCDEPPVPKNGIVIGTSREVGSTIEFRCKNDNHELFWKNCKFNGEAGLCKEFCPVTYTCVPEIFDEDNHTEMVPVWEGFAGNLTRISCKSVFEAKLATFLRVTSLVVHVATKGAYASNSTKPHLIGC